MSHASCFQTSPVSSETLTDHLRSVARAATSWKPFQGLVGHRGRSLVVL